MYGIYYDYYGYECALMCVCDTIIECKKLFYDNCTYKGEYDAYTIVKLEKNNWDYFNEPIDSMSRIVVKNT